MSEFRLDEQFVVANRPRWATNEATNEAWHARAVDLTPGGVHSNARLIGADVVFTHGDGPWLFDVEGRRHVDYMLGRGPAFLGHTPEVVITAVADAARRGLTLGSGTTAEIEAAAAVLSVVEWADRVRFVSSGTEAVQSAFRLARAATGRSLVVQFEGQYHGWVDSVSLVAGRSPREALAATSGQVPNSGAQTVLLQWNDLAALEHAFDEHGGDIAAVITEPINIFAGILPASGYLAAMRRLTERHGAVLIFDEVVTGFRLRPGSAASIVGVTPDLATYAKAMGSGWPVAAVAGAAALFEGVETDRVRLSGTYNGNGAVMAAVIATVQATSGGGVHQRLETWGRKLMLALTAGAADLGVLLRCEGFPSAFWFVFDGLDRAASDAAAETLGLILRDHQVVQYHHTWLPSAAHDDEALAFTLDRFGSALTELLKRGVLS